MFVSVMVLLMLSLLSVFLVDFWKVVGYLRVFVLMMYFEFCMSCGIECLVLMLFGLVREMVVFVKLVVVSLLE